MSSYSGVARNRIKRKTSRVGESTGRSTKAGGPRSIPWEPYLIDSLKNPKEAEGYLNAALDDDDPRLFLLALRDVAEAHGGMSKIARTCKLNRESLYRMLSPLSQCLRGLFLIREKVMDYLEEQVLSKTHVDLYAEEETERRLNRFFDLLVIHLAHGYERALRKAAVANV